MKKMLSVIAPAGRICPMEGGKPAGIITDGKAVSVPNTSYYRRLLVEGSLCAPEKIKSGAEQASKKGGTKE